MEAYDALMEHYAADAAHFELAPGLSPADGYEALRTEHVYCGASFGRSLIMAMMAMARGDEAEAEQQAREGLLQLWRDAIGSAPESPWVQAARRYHTTAEAVMREMRAPHTRPDGTCTRPVPEARRDADPRVNEARRAFQEADTLYMGPVRALARQHSVAGAPRGAW